MTYQVNASVRYNRGRSANARGHGASRGTVLRVTIMGQAKTTLGFNLVYSIV